MRAKTIGAGEPELAIVGGIHGDEPCGVAAVERLMENPPSVDRPVLLLIANEQAVERGVRYIDADLNRAFPGNPTGNHEEKLAARLRDRLSETVVLALHSTQSYGEPFAIVDELAPWSRPLCRRLPVESVVETGPNAGGRVFEVADVIEVECGRQWSDAATENAHAVCRAFLAATGAVPNPAPPRSLPVYRLRSPVPKSAGRSYSVTTDNFSRVSAGETFAMVDGEPVRAKEPFYPILLSAEGYEDIFGYAADQVTRLTADESTAEYSSVGVRKEIDES